MSGDEEKGRAKTLAKVAEIVKLCPHFGDWDWCNENCLLYDFCDRIYESMDLSKIEGGG